MFWSVITCLVEGLSCKQSVDLTVSFLLFQIYIYMFYGETTIPLGVSAD